MAWLHHKLLSIKQYFLFIEWTKQCFLPIFSPLPLHTILVFFLAELKKETLHAKASSLAYTFIMAIFPAIIFLFTLIPFLPNGFQNQLLAFIELMLPENAYLAFKSTILEIIQIQRGGLLSFGFIFSAVFATNGVHQLMKAFNKSSLRRENRSWLKIRLIATLLTATIAFAVILCLSAMTIGEIALNYINVKGTIAAFFIQLTRWALLIGLYFITISILYKYGPAHAKDWKLFSAGAWLATFLAIITFWGFSFYIKYFGSYNKIYGSIGTLIVVMIWLYLNSLILLIGFELNASVDLSKKSVKIIKPMTLNEFKNG
ncbi:MAG: YihY/virulence factor BrkB family protein [Sphingobacteriaceae bacterium]|nr:YihY/virulence factor BrkB family protein [Sphingobacteriaceae bacterium]